MFKVYEVWNAISSRRYNKNPRAKTGLKIIVIKFEESIVVEIIIFWVKIAIIMIS